MRISLRLIGILVLLVITIAAAEAMIATLKLPDLVRKADIIALVTVVSTSETATDKDQITTCRNELKLDKLIKGIWKPTEPMVVETRQSGQPGQIGWIEDQPQFPAKGQQCLVFLARSQNDVDRLEIVNLVQGIWPIIEGQPAGMGLGTKVSQIEEIVKQQRN